MNSKNSVYKTHCKTWSIACNMTNSNGQTSTISDAFGSQAPFCLRTVKKFRNPETTNFRNLVAAEVLKSRKALH
jgi:hypothetical protein